MTEKSIVRLFALCALSSTAQGTTTVCHRPTWELELVSEVRDGELQGGGSEVWSETAYLEFDFDSNGLVVDELVELHDALAGVDVIVLHDAGTQ